MNNDHLEYLQAMGITVWREREMTEKNKDKGTIDVSSERADWRELEQNVSQCRKCELAQTRIQTVFGVGNQQADLLIIGEAPGDQEDQQGEPFVGRGGKLLTSMLQSIGLEREDIYIANILKCRPPKNRDPLPCEVECCTPYLQKQITLLQPKIMVAVGRIAAQFLLETKEALGRLRGKIYHYGEQQTPLIVTYHPAYLLRSPKEKSKAYEDLLRVQKLLSGQKTDDKC